MKKCCFIIPYFGKLPNYFQLFLKTCSKNPLFNWIVFTDDETTFNYPSNVMKVYMTFGSLRKLVQSKFDFEISLDKPYKLCDYKPAYGFIFEDYLKKFEYWGHCDVDTIMGNLDKFLSPLFEKDYDKLFCLGHMTIYKNTIENNRVFMKPYKNSVVYKEVFSCPEICWFDESWKDEFNINSIFEICGRQIYKKDLSFNLNTRKAWFYRIIFEYESIAQNRYYTENFVRAAYIWDDGCLYRTFERNHSLEKEEFPYMHFQYRIMTFDKCILSAERFQIIPDKFCRLKKLPALSNIRCISMKFFPWNRFRLKFKALKIKVTDFIKR